MDAIAKIKLTEDKVLKVYHDPDPMNPRIDCDNLGTMAIFHGRYNFGDKVGMSREEVSEYVKRPDVIALPIYMYDHSGITISTKPFRDPWDSGQVGYIYVSKEKAIKEYGKDFNKKKILSYLQGEVKVMDDYLTGRVYGYEIIQHSENCFDEKCPHHVKEIESCWGYYGEWKESGILDDLSPEDKALALAHN